MTRQPCLTRSHTALRSPRALCVAGRLTLCCVHVRRRCAACCAACLPVKLAVTRARQVLPLSALLLLLLQLRGYTLSLCLFVCSGFIFFLFYFANLSIFFLRSFCFGVCVCVCMRALSYVLSLSLSVTCRPGKAVPAVAAAVAITACCCLLCACSFPRISNLDFDEILLPAASLS